MLMNCQILISNDFQKHAYLSSLPHDICSERLIDDFLFIINCEHTEKPLFVCNFIKAIELKYERGFLDNDFQFLINEVRDWQFKTLANVYNDSLHRSIVNIKKDALLLKDYLLSNTRLIPLLVEDFKKHSSSDIFNSKDDYLSAILFLKYFCNVNGKSPLDNDIHNYIYLHRFYLLKDPLIDRSDVPAIAEDLFLRHTRMLG